MDPKRWKVGELAKATGLTVRTLHHYDEIGLLVPADRSEAGYRLYTEADVRRLYRIGALRRLGLSLPDIGAVLDREGADVRVTLRRHLEQVDAEIEQRRELRERLRRILDALDSGDEPSAGQFLEAIEVMTMYEKHYSPDQLDELDRRRREAGPDAMERAQRDWAELMAEFEAERARGTDPGDPRVRSLAERWEALIEEFTGGDPGIRASLERLYDEQGPEAASRGLVSPELMEYVRRATAS